MIRLFIILLFLTVTTPVMAEGSLHSASIDDAMHTSINMSAEVEHDMHAQGAHEKSAGLPQFNTATFASQIFWLLIAFVLMYVFFAKKALPKLSTTIEKRQLTIKTDLKQADKLSVDAEIAKYDYEQEIAQAQIKARQEITNTEKHLREQADSEFKAFQKSAMQDIADLEARCEAAKDAIKDELSKTAAVLTKEIIEKTTSVKVTDKDIALSLENTSNNGVKTPKAA